MPDLVRTAKAEWQGNLRNGQGRIDSESGVLKGEPYSFGTRFEQAPGTNPEELIAAAHAACYSMAFTGLLYEQGYGPERIETQASCVLSRVESGFKITEMRLQVRGKVPHMEPETFQRLAEQADRVCPVSNLLRAGLTIKIEAVLS